MAASSKWTRATVEAAANDDNGEGVGLAGPKSGLDPDAFAHALAEGAKPTGAFEEDGAVVRHAETDTNLERKDNITIGCG